MSVQLVIYWSYRTYKPYKPYCAIKPAPETTLSSPQNGLFCPLKRVIPASDMACFAMQYGLYRRAIQAILKSRRRFPAPKGGKTARKFSISAENEVLIFGRQETGDGRQAIAHLEIKNEEKPFPQTVFFLMNIRNLPNVQISVEGTTWQIADIHIFLTLNSSFPYDGMGLGRHRG